MAGLGIGCCVGFVLLLVVEEIGGAFLNARRSGWRRLATRYPGPGRRRVGVECRARVGDRWVAPPVTVAVTAAGLGLAVRPLVGRASHRPVLIPWDDVAVVSDDWDGGDLPLVAGDVAFVRLTGPAVPAVLRHLGRAARRTRHDG